MDQNYIDVSQIESCLSGIGRIIYFRQNNNDNNYSIRDVIEGYFHQGYIDGYARHMEVRKVHCDFQTNCKTGFWKK